jgi:crotonobetainyl-CoA:carnitine CoA-transferase CaiB-like acyl-CoA transferase
VVDVTTSYAGPTCTQLLGALGADVVKVEPPAGDEARSWGPPFAGDSGRCSSRRTPGSARSRSTSARDRRVLRLVDRADVFVQSLRPGLADELGLGAEALRRGSRSSCTARSRPTGARAEARAARLRPAAPGGGGLISVTGEPGGAASASASR